MSRSYNHLQREIYTVEINSTDNGIWIMRFGTRNVRILYGVRSLVTVSEELSKYKDYRVLGLGLSSGTLSTRKHNVSETEPQGLVRPEELGRLKNIDLIGFRTRDGNNSVLL
jgi:hypothetical protein